MQKKHIMKKIISIIAISLTFLTFFFHGNLNAQNHNKTDNSGRRQGKWIGYHDNGQISYKGQFKNNEAVGEFLYYSEDGVLIAKNKHHKNSNITDSEMYSPSGKVIAKGSYVNKKKQGQWDYFSAEDGSLILTENYNNGLLSGKSIVYLAGTQIVVEETEYVNGIKHGLYSKFYDNGVPMIEAAYHQDHLNGSYIHYYSNGIVKEEGLFKNGAKVGEWKTYDTEGYIISTDSYEVFDIDADF